MCNTRQTGTRLLQEYPSGIMEWPLSTDQSNHKPFVLVSFTLVFCFWISRGQQKFWVLSQHMSLVGNLNLSSTFEFRFNRQTKCDWPSRRYRYNHLQVKPRYVNTTHPCGQDLAILHGVSGSQTRKTILCPVQGNFFRDGGTLLEPDWGGGQWHHQRRKRTQVQRDSDPEQLLDPEPKSHTTMGRKGRSEVEAHSMFATLIQNLHCEMHCFFPAFYKGAK